MERKYFVSNIGLKAQIAPLPSGSFCLTLYGYADAICKNQVIEQKVYETYKGARIALGKVSGNLCHDIKFKESSYDEFINSFNYESEEPVEADDDAEEMDFPFCDEEEQLEKLEGMSVEFYRSGNYILEVIETVGACGLMCEFWLQRENCGYKSCLVGLPYEQPDAVDGKTHYTKAELIEIVSAGLEEDKRFYDEEVEVLENAYEAKLDN